MDNGSWAPTAGGLIKKELSALKGTEFIGETLSIKSGVKGTQLADLDAIADAIAADIAAAKQ